MLYVVSGNGTLDQIEGSTGTLRRTVVATSQRRSCTFRGPLMLTSRLVVAGFGSGSLGQSRLRAFDRVTGQQRWSQAAGQGLVPSMSRLGRRLFVPTSDGEIACLNVDTGQREWSVSVELGDRGSLAVAVDRVFAGTSGGVLYALNASTGRPEWRTELGAPITTTVRRSERALFAGTQDGRVHRVDIRTGQLVTSRRLGSRLVPRSAPIVSDQGLLFQSADDAIGRQTLVQLDRTLTHLRWQVTPDDPLSAARVLAWKDIVAVGTRHGTVLAYCADDGSPAWQHTVTGTVLGITPSDDNVLYIGTAEGVIEAVRPPDVCRTAH
jgi:outer membrane protein assembly factor BamB